LYTLLAIAVNAERYIYGCGFLKIIFDFKILKYIKTLKIFLKHKNK
jgi:hypothetical protein